MCETIDYRVEGYIESMVKLVWPHRHLLLSSSAYLAHTSVLINTFMEDSEVHVAVTRNVASSNSGVPDTVSDIHAGEV